VSKLQITTGGFPAEYGNGLGAVVDITTRRSTGRSAGEAQIAYGTYGTYDASANYSRDLGKASLFVGGNVLTTDRGLDTPAVSPILHDAMTSGSVFSRVDYLTGPHERLELLGSFNQTRYQIPIDPTLEPSSGATRGPDIYGNTPPPFVPYDANPVDLEQNLFAAVSYQRSHENSVVQIAPFVRRSFGQLTCDPEHSLGASADFGSSCSDVRRDVWHGGTVASVGWTQGSHSWKAGATVDFARSHVDYTAYFRDDDAAQGGPNPSRTLSGHDDTDVLLAGAYVQDRMSFGRWTVFPGLRLDSERATFADSGLDPLLLVGPSVRLGASYAVTDQLVAHAFAGYLWQPPSTIDGPVAARVLVPSLAGRQLPVDVKAEKDWATEVGVEDRMGPCFTWRLTGWGRLATDQLDRQNVGTTNLVASYNFARGRAVGVEAAAIARVGHPLDGFANAGWQMAQGQGISSEQYLFTPDEVASQAWVMLDHVQTWTANVGVDLHDERGASHLSGYLNYGSGMRTGTDSQLSVPSHATLDLTLRHRFDMGVMGFRPEVAVDVFNVFDCIYAYRIASGYVGSAYAPLRRVVVRVTAAFGQ
jgi:hypothetical protein